MKPYSMDLRQRVIEAYAGGEGTQEQLAERFDVSVSWIERLVRSWRETGSIAPKPHGGGQKPKVCDEKLKKAVEETPDATLEELRQKCGTDGSIMAVFRGLRRLNIRRKKSRCVTPNS